MCPKYTINAPKTDNFDYLNDELYQAITVNKDYFDFLQHNALDGFFILNCQNGEHLFCSHKLLELLGYASGFDIKDIYESWKDLIFAEDQIAFRDRILSGEICHLEDNKITVRFVHSHKYILWLECNVISFNNSTSEKRILAAVKDITKFTRINIFIR